MSNYSFIIVGKNDNPIYEAEFSSGQKVLFFNILYLITFILLMFTCDLLAHFHNNNYY